MCMKVDHQLQRTSQIEYVIQEPKTESGICYVPMTAEVADYFRWIIEKRKAPKTEPMVDGYVHFLFLDKNDMPMVALHWEKYMQHIIQKHNKNYRSRCRKLHLMYADIHFALRWRGPEWPIKHCNILWDILISVLRWILIPMWILMMQKKNCKGLWVYNPIGKCFVFTKNFTNFAEESLRKYKKIWEDTWNIRGFQKAENPWKWGRLRRKIRLMRR